MSGRTLPGDFPEWRTVYFYFQQWTEQSEESGSSLFEQALKKQVSQARLKQGGKAKTSFCIIDAQSVKNTDAAKEKGYDTGKKVSGIKRHIAVDTQKLRHAIAVTPANITDRAGTLLAFNANKEKPGEVQAILADGGYTGERFAEDVKEAINASVQIAKRSDLHTFAVIPKRWVVERSFVWLDKCRRLWKNCERKLDTSLQFVNLAFLVLLPGRL